MGAARRAIATAAHLARDHRGPEGVLGPPVGRVEGLVEEEAEDRREFGAQVHGDAARVREAAGSRGEQVAEPVDVGTARDRQTVLGHPTDAMAVTGRQRGADREGRAVARQAAEW